jgi:hypothetical protein
VIYAIRAVAGALAAVLILAVVSAFSSGIDLSFRTDVPEQRLLWRGFYPPELAEAGGAFAWAARTAEWRLRGLDRSHAWTADLRVRPAIADSSPLIVLVDGLSVATVDSATFTNVTFSIPASTHTGAVIGLSAARAVVPGTSDPRELGAAVQSLRLTPSRQPLLGLSRTLVVAAGAIGGAFGALSVLLELGTLEAAVLVLFTSTIWATMALIGVAPVASFDADSLRSLAAAGVIAAIALVWRRRPGWNRFTGRALAIVCALTFLRLCFIVHPAFGIGDSGFHLHRLQMVLRGEYFFLSNAPGGAFPYAPAFYAIVGLLTPLTRGWITLMRVVAVAADAGAGLLLYSAIVRNWQRAGVGVIAVLLYLLIPAGFQIHAVAYLTNGFAQTMAVSGLALLTLAANGSKRRVALGAAFIALTVALLSHTGTFLLLWVLLVLLPLMLWLTGDVAARRLAPAAAVVAICAIVSSGLLYYGHFTTQYAAMLSARPAAARPSTPGEIPVQRAEAHQTKWVRGWTPLRNRLAAVPGYTSRYLGFVLLAAAASGLTSIMRSGSRDPLSILLAAWCATCVFFFVLGQLTPIDIRYYLAIFPALGILAALAIDIGMRRGGPARFVSVAAVAWWIATGIAYWFAWFEPVTPR